MKKAFGVATVLVLMIGLSPSSGHAAGKGGPHGKAASSEGKFEAAESAQEAFEARNAPAALRSPAGAQLADPRIGRRPAEHSAAEANGCPALWIPTCAPGTRPS